MGTTTAETLYRIAGSKADAGHGWDALTAYLAADAMTVSAVMEQNPSALLDLAPLRDLDLPSGDLPSVVDAFRSRLLSGLGAFGSAGAVRAALPGVTLAATFLDADSSFRFASGWLAGRSLEEFAPAQAAKAARLAQLAGRLYGTGELLAASRSGLGADTASFAARYGAEAAATGDVHLAGLRTGLLLAEEALAAEGGTPAGIADAAAQSRRIYDAANLTETPIHWEPLPYLN